VIANRSGARGCWSQTYRGSWTGRSLAARACSDQTPAARRILEEAANLHVAAQLACVCRYAELCHHHQTLCQAVRNNGPNAFTIQSCVLVAPAGALHVAVWSPYKSRACFLQPHLVSEQLWRRGREESPGTPKRSVVETNVSQSTGSKASLAEVDLMVPSHERASSRDSGPLRCWLAPPSHSSPLEEWSL
jgi:hypothetical protein